MSRLKLIAHRAWRYIIHGQAVNKVIADIHVKQPSDLLKGKHIVVTGGGRGIGFALAKKFVEEGASVLISGRNEDTLKRSSSEIGCKWLRLDVQDVDNFNGFIKEAESSLGGLDCLVNNAGISLHEHSFLDVTPEGFDSQISTNLRGSFFLSQQFIKSVIDRGVTGNVLFISSETGETVDLRPYGLSKAALNSLVQGLAHAYAAKKIRVNAVSPGVTATELTGVSLDNLYYGDNTINRAYLPEEIAEVACFMLSDLSGCISGQIITCNNAKTVNARWKK